MKLEKLVLKLKSYHFLSDLLTYEALIQFGKYIITGLLAAGTEYSVFRFLLKTLGGWFVPSNIGMFSGFIVSFIINRVWSFKSKDNVVRQFTLTSILFIINLLLSNVLMYLLSETIKIAPSASKLIVMGMIIIWNFILYKKVIYKQ